MSAAEPKKIEMDYPNARFRYYLIQHGGYSTIQQLEQLLMQVQPKRIIAYDFKNPLTEFQIDDVEIQANLPYKALNLSFIEGTNFIDLTGALYCPSTTAQPADINVDPILN